MRTNEEIYEELEVHIKKRLSPKRFSHTMGVIEAARALADRYGVSLHKAHMAALLHDVMKESPLEEMQRFVKVGQIPVDEDMLINGALLHGPAGAAYAKLALHITDKDILEAIRVHTLGSTTMSTLDKIIFLADYIEPGRDFPGVEELRKIAMEDLNQAVISAYNGTIQHLLDLGLPIHEETIRGRNQIIREEKRLMHGRGKAKT